MTLSVGGALRRACHVSDVPFGEGRAITIGGRRIALFHAPGGWYALDAACPHLGGPLADGLLADRRVICPLHERAFDLASGESPSGDRVCAHVVRVIGDEVWVALSLNPPILAAPRRRGPSPGTIGRRTK